MSTRLTKTIIDKISENIIQTDLIIQNNFQQHQCRHRVILIGTTGNGKSSLANLLIGQKLIISKNRFDDIILTSSNEKFKMGSYMSSETTVPNIFYDKSHDILICDPPGFNDSREEKNLQDIINAFAINELFAEPCKISILLVISGDEINISGGRGESFREKLEQICQMIPDKEKLKQCLGLVISRPRKSIAKYLESLTYSSNINVREWSQFFLNEINYRVFSFPEPSEADIGKLYSLIDKEKIYRFVCTASVENPKHKIILGNDSLMDLMNIIRNIPKIDELLYELCNMIKDSITTINNQRVLTQWETFKKKLNGNIKTLKQLINVIQSNIISPDKYQKIIMKMKYIENIYSFLSKIEQLSQVTMNYDISSHLHTFSTQLANLIENGKYQLTLKKLSNEKKMINQQMIKIQNDSKKTITEINRQKLLLQMQLRTAENKSQMATMKIDEIRKLIEQEREKQRREIDEINQQNQIIFENLRSQIEYYQNRQRTFYITDCVPIFGRLFKIGWKIGELLK